MPSVPFRGHGRQASGMRIGRGAIPILRYCMAIRNLKSSILRKIREQRRPEAVGSGAPTSDRAEQGQSSVANPHHAHQGFLDVDEFALALVFFLGAVGESFFQQNQVAAKFELGEHQAA